MNYRKTLVGASFLIFSLLFSCERNNDGEANQRNGGSFSPQEQAFISSRILDAILSNPADFPVLEETDYPEAYQYLKNSILNTVINTSGITKRNNLSREIYILHDDEKRHAFFLPGGEFFIHTGLLKYLKNEAELLSVVAHEIAYVNNDYVLENLKNEFTNVTLNDLADDKPVDNLNEIGRHFKTIEYEQTATLFADSFAVSLICPFSYDPNSLKNIIQNIEDNSDIVDWHFRKICDQKLRYEKIDEVLLLNSSCVEGNSVVTRREVYSRFITQDLP